MGQRMKGLPEGRTRRGGRVVRRAVLFALVLSVVPLAGAALAPAPAVHDIDWRTSPLDLNLRGFNGERFRFRCPPGKAAAGQVIGSGPYTDGSSICAAGVHAGVIRAAGGGLVTIEMRPGEAHYLASLSHYVQSEAYDKFWSGSFLVISPDPAESSP
jgi:LCCL domain-containing protein